MHILKKYRFLPAVCLCALLLQCAGTKNVVININNRQPRQQGAGETLVAGVAKVDITPRPGLPMIGHSLLGKRGNGVRTKLMARVVYIRSAQGSAIAVVQTDLLAGSLILHHRVAELIADATDVSAAGLCIAGTHTHSAPGNVFESNFYNDYAGPVGGFNPEYFDFLAKRIAGAVIEAYGSARSAKIASGSVAVYKATKNRSLPAYHRNPPAKVSKPDVFEAVNPELHLIRIDCKDTDGVYRPIGALSNFSIHPNIPNEGLEELYSGDNFTYIAREVEWGIKRRYKLTREPVHASANYTHGDNTPHYRDDLKLGFVECRRVGKMIGDRALELFVSLEGKLTDRVPVNFRAREIDVFVENGIEGEHLCDTPAVGMALVAGAADRDRNVPVLRSLPGFAPGWPKRTCNKGCQKEKNILMGALQPMIIPKKDFPHNLFMQVLRIGDTVLIPLPFEVCYQAGSRIAAGAREQAGAALRRDVSSYIVMSTSNGYWGYVTTPEEYSLQYYEGGHTLYGPGTAGFLRAQVVRLIGELQEQGDGGELPASWSISLKTRPLVARERPSKGRRGVTRDPEFRPVKTGKKDEEPYWFFEWRDLPPGEIAFDKPLLRMEMSTDGTTWQPLVIDGVPVDENCYDIAVICVKERTKENMGIYRACWYNPPRLQNTMFRFVVPERPGEGELHSPFFTNGH